MRRQRGFTLVEAIIAMVITGIVAAMIAVFIAAPVQGYIDTLRRAGLTDTADLALKRMALEIRTAVPNSVRVDGTGRFIEFIPAQEGGRYCTDTESCPSGTGGALSFSVANDAFDVLGPTHSASAGQFLVVYNTAQSGLNAYAGDNLRLIAAVGTTTTAIAFTGAALPYASPSNRFQVVPASGPVSFACESVVGGASTGTGTLRRYTGYNTGAAFLNPQSTDTSAAGLGKSAAGSLLADNLTGCDFTYDAINASNGLVSLRITLSREAESVTLLHQLHVDNMP